MDIEVGGITFVQFIKSFKEIYKLTDTTYDYMSFLKIVDNCSYCSLMKQYNNPNDVLNFFITPELNSIIFTGGGKKVKNMKGGQGLFLILVVSLFTLSLGTIYQGPTYQEIVRKYGDNPASWPKAPGSQPQYPKPEDTWYSFIMTFGPSQESIDKYNQEIADWNSQNAEYRNYQSLLLKSEQEFKQILDVEQVKAKTLEFQAQTEQIQAQTGYSSAQADLTTAQTALNSQKAAEIAMARIARLYEESADRDMLLSEVKGQLKMLYGIIMGIGGTFAVLIGYMYMFKPKPRNRGRLGRGEFYEIEDDYDDYPGPSRNRLQIQNAPPPQNDLSENRLQIEDASSSRKRTRYGGKTKNYRKKRTTRKRR